MRETADIAPKIPQIVGPEFRGNHLIVEGRVIPRMAIHKFDGYYELVLDDRFSLNVSEDEIYPVSWFVATAMAVGAGFASINSDAPGRPFAPKIMNIDDLEGGDT